MKKFKSFCFATPSSHLPFPLGEEAFEALRGFGDTIQIQQARDAYAPIACFLNQLICQKRQHTKETFVLGITGSVAVGKSTTARLLSFLFSSKAYHLHSVLVPTDGFLLSTAVLEEKNLMKKKGFPESFDTPHLTRFLQALKNGEAHLRVPVYSHELYDIVPGSFIHVDKPDVVILEGLNILPVAKNWVDFCIYIDADSADIETWFVSRFLKLRKNMEDPKAFFHRFSYLTDEEAEAFARSVWHEINLPNLNENILPARDLSDMIIEKNYDHSIASILINEC